MDADVLIRPIAEDDWPGIVTLEAGAYTPLGLSEGREALRSKARASPATCFVLDLGALARHRPAGYLLALPYPQGSYPDLARPESAVHRSRNLHLHDLVVAGEVRGRGLGRRLLDRLTTRARTRGYEQISLVAVGGSHAFWAANGFAARDGAAGPRGYGPGAVYMSMALTSGRSGGRPGGQAGGPPGDPDGAGAPRDRTPSRDEVG